MAPEHVQPAIKSVIVDLPLLHPEQMVAEVLRDVRRVFTLGALQVRSGDLQDQVLVDGADEAVAWEVTGPASLRARPQATEVAYDFRKADGPVRLSQTFTLGFPVDRLQRVQLAVGSDDSWHSLALFLEKGGVRYRAVRAHVLANFDRSVMTWQEPGPDDAGNRIRTWILLREVARGPQYEAGPDRVRIELLLEPQTRLGAWWAKITRNCRLALDHLPFGRYVATSLFLVLLNISSRG